MGFSIALLVYKGVKYTKMMFMNQLLNQWAMTTTCSSMMKPYHVVQMFKSPPFCGSTTQFPSFFVADLYQEFSVFNMVQLLKYHWLKQSAYFFSIVQSIFSLVKTSHVPCLYSINDMLPSSAEFCCSSIPMFPHIS